MQIVAFQDHRDRAAAAFAEHGWPGRNDEQWLGSDRKAFIEPTAPAAAASEIPDGILVENGRLAGAAEGVSDLESSCEDDRVAYHFGSTLAEHPSAFTNQNTMHFRGGVFVEVAAGASSEITLVHHTSEAVAYPRVLIHVQDGGQLTIHERFIGGGATYAVTEIVAHRGAVVHHTKSADLDTEAVHLHGIFANVEADAHLHQANLSWSGHSVRNTVRASLLSAGAHADLTGLSLTTDQQRVDNWTRVDHAVPDTTSREVYKSVLDGKSRARFTGNVLVRHGAIRTSAEQENRNLLLSRGALAESTPQLEIHADDVQASHGSTVGRLDEDALFFLRARGIGADDARRMLTKAFVGEVIDGLPDAARAVAENAVDAWFEAGKVVA